METKNLSLLIEIVRRGSFAAAAKEQLIDPSSVSRVIAKLEEELGFRLFQRSTRRMALTEAGHLFMKRVEPVMDELLRARAEALDITSGATGTLRLTASVAYGHSQLMPLMPEFRARYPGLKLELVFSDSNLDLVADRIDLAVRLAPALEGELVAAKLTDTFYRVVASPAYLAQHGRPMSPDGLIDHICLLLDLPGFRARWLFRAGQGDIQPIAVSGDLKTSSPLALRSAALSGLGVALLANWLVEDDLVAGRLIDLFPEHGATPTNFDTAAGLVYPSRAFVPRKVRLMVDYLREHLGRHGEKKKISRAKPVSSIAHSAMEKNDGR